LVATSDGGYALAGSTTLGVSISDYAYFWLVKTDELGNREWNRTYGLGVAFSVVAASDGGYALAGYKGSFWTPVPCLVKTDALGNMQWNWTYGEIGGFVARSLIATNDGGYVLAGGSWLVKTDALGNVEWNRTCGYYVNSVVATSDGGYALAGGRDDNFWLVKTDAFGNMQWNMTYGGTGVENGYALLQSSDGGYVLTGSTNSFGAGGNYFWLVKTDALGNMQWNQTYGEGSAYSLVATSDGGYALAGAFLLVKINQLGNMEWNQTYFGQWLYTPNSLVATPDGGYALAGYTSMDSTPSVKAWLIKTDEFGVVPEYSSWLIPALVLTATAFILINKKRLIRARSQQP
jgi:predicted secreted protein